MATHDLNIEKKDTVSNAHLIERMKLERNNLLAVSDWTQVADNPISNKAAWATYRQTLRDFPATWTPANTVTFEDTPA
tara:strand:- start:78 stop:311 length:234 start_codon:yes stop_codon:yes gene_type:complete